MTGIAPISVARDTPATHSASRPGIRAASLAAPMTEPQPTREQLRLEGFELIDDTLAFLIGAASEAARMPGREAEYVAGPSRAAEMGAIPVIPGICGRGCRVRHLRFQQIRRLLEAVPRFHCGA